MPNTTIYDPMMAISDILILLSGATVAVFLIIYTHRFQWRSTIPGRATGYFLMSLVAVLALSGLARWLGPDYIGREYLRLLVYGSVLATSIRMLLALLSFYEAPVPEGSFLPTLKHGRHPTTETESTP